MRMFLRWVMLALLTHAACAIMAGLPKPRVSRLHFPVLSPPSARSRSLWLAEPRRKRLKSSSNGAYTAYPPQQDPREVSGPRPDGESAVSVCALAIATLEEQQRTGAPLDLCVSRCVRSCEPPLSARARGALNEVVSGVARRHARLNARIAGAGGQIGSRARVLADLVVTHGAIVDEIGRAMVAAVGDGDKATRAGDRAGGGRSDVGLRQVGREAAMDAGSAMKGGSAEHGRAGGESTETGRGRGSGRGRESGRRRGDARGIEDQPSRLALRTAFPSRLSAAESAWLRRLEGVPLEPPEPIGPVLTASPFADARGTAADASAAAAAAAAKSNSAISPARAFRRGQPPSRMDSLSRLECPAWAWPHFEDAFGDGAIEQVSALRDPAPLDLRVNTLKTDVASALARLHNAGIDATRTPLSPEGVRLARRLPLHTLPGLREGEVEVQDEGSQLLALLVGAAAGETVADFCAGGGGKTLAMAAHMRNKGRLVAMDIDGGRLDRGSARYIKAGVTNVQRHEISAGSDSWLKRRKRSFDRVLVDAPCSGVGAWRRNPDARWLRRGPQLEELLPIQAQVLERAARLVRPGGRLVYSTCSLFPSENERQVLAFLDADREFKLDPPADFPVPLSDGFLRLTPARHGCDGFFAAVMTRVEQ